MLAASQLKQFGIDRKAVYRAIRLLEVKKLIEATRSSGKRPRIKIIKDQLETEE